jgi:hypothetical protein
MVERFVLPECRSGSSQNPVCPTSRSALQPSHDARHFGERLEDRVNVVWHDHPRIEMVEAPDLLTIPKSAGNGIGDAAIPAWNRKGATSRKQQRHPETNRAGVCGKRSCVVDQPGTKSDHKNRWSSPLLTIRHDQLVRVVIARIFCSKCRNSRHSL